LTNKCAVCHNDIVNDAEKTANDIRFILLYAYSILLMHNFTSMDMTNDGAPLTQYKNRQLCNYMSNINWLMHL